MFRGVLLLSTSLLVIACSRGQSGDTSALAPAATPMSVIPTALPMGSAGGSAVGQESAVLPNQGTPTSASRKSFTETAPDQTYKLTSAQVTVEGAPQTHYYHFKAPAGYNANKSVSYPLVVYLHAFGFSNKREDLKELQPYAPGEIQALADDKVRPAFVYVPVCPLPYAPDNNMSAAAGGEWNSPAAKAMVVATIRNLSERFNIDRRRIYLAGFSMGGAGTYYIGEAFKEETKSRFAAVIRGVGWSPTMDKTSIHSALAASPVWIHVGGNEGNIVTLCQESYAALKRVRLEQGGVETTEVRRAGEGLIAAPYPPDLVADVATVTMSGNPVARLSVYRNRGHEEGLMFQNADLLDWMYSQAIPQTEVF